MESLLLGVNSAHHVVMDCPPSICGAEMWVKGDIDSVLHFSNIESL